MEAVLKSIFSIGFVFTILRVTTPLLYASIGVAISNQSGTVNIALEGIMLFSAFIGVLVSALTKNLIISFLIGSLAGISFALLLGYFSMKLKANIILSGIALNMLASGLTVFLLYLASGDKGVSSSLNSLAFPVVHIPLIKELPYIGKALSGHNLLTYLSFLSVIIFYILIYKTPIGLRIRAVGQNPNAASSVGISVFKTKMLALALSGFFGALGGLYLSMGYVTWFGRDMVAGRGFIAIAASTIGGHKPIGVLLASILFGLTNALAIYFKSLRVPSEFIELIPYLATIVFLVFYSLRTKEDK